MVPDSSKALVNLLLCCLHWRQGAMQALAPLPPPPPDWPPFNISSPLADRFQPPEPPAGPLWPQFSPTASAPPAAPIRSPPPDAAGTARPLPIVVSSSVAAAVMLGVLGALWAVVRQRRKQRGMEATEKAAELQGGRGPRRSGSSSGRSVLSRVQSRKVEVPETTQMFISTVRPAPAVLCAACCVCCVLAVSFLTHDAGVGIGAPAIHVMHALSATHAVRVM